MAGFAFCSLAALAMAASAPAKGPQPQVLAPDLATLPIGAHDLRALVEHRTPVLRLANEIMNRGPGPLEIFPSTASTGCDGDSDPTNDRTASQRLFADTNSSGAFERGFDGVASERAVGCVHYHAAHAHWHVLDSAEYELRSSPDGPLAARTRKVGFCLGDNRLAFPGAGVPVAPVYPFGSQSTVPCDAAATQGLSVGYADRYAPGLPGQQLELSGLERGRYCLIARADPRRLLAELDERNNARRTLIRLRPEVPSVRRIAGRC